MTTELEKGTPFEEAEYYDCRDSEVLHMYSVEEALEEHIEGFLTPDCDTAAEIRKLCPIVVRAFDRKIVSEGDVKSITGSCFDRIIELFTEEYGDPDGGNDGFGKEETAVSIAELLPVVRKILSRGTVWPCVKVAERAYEAEETIALMREQCPEWFEDFEEPIAAPEGGGRTVE